MGILFKESVYMRRPWGWMVRFIHITPFWVKLIRVYPGEATSDQLHRERTEYHVYLPRVWSSKKIRPGERHRMEGGWYIEVATGRPREDDIVRFDDKYGRV